MGRAAFASSGLVEVNFPANLRRIWNVAFSGCSSMHHIDLSCLSPDAEIGQMAFALSGLVEVNFPANLRCIGDEAFSGCASLVSGRLPRELDALGMKVFVGCPSLQVLAVGDVRHWMEPVGLLSDARLERLELIRLRCNDLPIAAASGWLADGAEVVSASFVGRRLGRFAVRAD
jgi:hypothetical protein